MSGTDVFSNKSRKIAIIGSGASGCICAYFLLKAGIEVTLFDFSAPLRTLLPTGGGRCNLAHAEYDFKELAKNYPRGEKFLYSVFSKFSTYDTISLFEELDIPTYIQKNGRIFPESNSAKKVREKILEKIKKAEFVKEKVIGIEVIEGGYKITTENPSPASVTFAGGSRTAAPSPARGEGKECSRWWFPHVVIAIGGKSSFNILKNLNINIIEPKPSLVGLNCDIKIPSGIVLKNVLSGDMNIKDDLLFTHFGISGPLAYTISSIKAGEKFPYKLSFDLYPQDFNLQELLNTYPHKDFKNILAEIFPANFAKAFLGEFSDTKACKIDGKTRDCILNKIHNFEVTITGTNKGEETVTAGGVDLDEINPKTMEAKNYPNLYFIGEVLNIDGFCGGFNLQNAWSTAYVAAESIIQI